MLKKCVTMEVLKSKINSCYCVTGLKFLSKQIPVQKLQTRQLFILDFKTSIVTHFLSIYCFETVTVVILYFIIIFV